MYADVRSAFDDVTPSQGPTAWGGKGDAPGKFNTAHGVFAWDDHIYVANREAGAGTLFATKKPLQF